MNEPISLDEVHRRLTEAQDGVEKAYVKLYECFTWAKANFHLMDEYAQEEVSKPKYLEAQLAIMRLMEKKD